MRTARQQIDHQSKTGSRGKKTSIGRGNVGCLLYTSDAADE